MKFNWIGLDSSDTFGEAFRIELEYGLRPRITQFLLQRLQHEYDGDLSDFIFNVDLNLVHVKIADATPVVLRNRILEDFDQEIGQKLINLYPTNVEYVNESRGSLHSGTI